MRVAKISRRFAAASTTIATINVITSWDVAVIVSLSTRPVIGKWTAPAHCISLAANLAHFETICLNSFS